MTESFFTDAVFTLTARWVLAAVFLVALVHKLKSPASFVVSMQGYRLLPSYFVTPIAFMVIGIEAVAVAGLAVNNLIGSIVAIALLAVYTSAISINIIRGRRDIDCGCSGPAVRQMLSGWLVGRNICLLLLAVLTLLPSSASRAFDLLDWYTAFASVITFNLIYSTANHISATNDRFGR